LITALIDIVSFFNTGNRWMNRKNSLLAYEYLLLEELFGMHSVKMLDHRLSIVPLISNITRSDTILVEALRLLMGST